MEIVEKSIGNFSTEEFAIICSSNDQFNFFIWFPLPSFLESQ